MTDESREPGRPKVSKGQSIVDGIIFEQEVSRPSLIYRVIVREPVEQKRGPVPK